MYAGRVACCPLVSHDEYMPTEQTDGRTPDRYIMLPLQTRNKQKLNINVFSTRRATLERVNRKHVVSHKSSAFF